ncbi:MAG TPA: hypothetical protein VFG42_06685 [Baekduia sp.]|uniref:hypothetical protein n=1 Tax=Baekduia sp. TaxID=2600305 RepID=UPI002D7786A0|nr:hypothetical protein [Baekduia sp.]HET6506457.1 hypothetical protein [Baekduia sp.]
MKTIVCVLLALLVPVAAAATASADPRYTAKVAITTGETFTYNQGGYPDDCDSWTHAEGELSARARASGPLIFASGGGYTVGGLSITAKSETNVSRLVTYKVHTASAGGACGTCDPHTELGDCPDQTPRPDDVGRSSCPGSPTTARSAARLTFNVKGTLLVEGNTPSRKVLQECSRLFPVPYGVPIGSAELPLQKEAFPGAARQVAKLAKGKSKKFRKADKVGGSCGKKKVVMAVCTTHETVVVVTRVS